MSSSGGCISPAAVRTVSTTQVPTWQICTKISSERRSRVSASTPAGSASIRTGSMEAVCTSATRVSARGSSTSSHCAPTVCIQLPILLANTASHSIR